MHAVLLVVHICVCLALILIVLLQAGKGGGMGIFGGGGSSDSLFSAPSGSAFLKKATTIIAIVFIITSIGLTYFASHRGMKTVTRQGQPGPAPAPVGQAVPEPESAPVSESQPSTNDADQGKQ